MYIGVYKLVARVYPNEVKIQNLLTPSTSEIEAIPVGGFYLIVSARTFLHAAFVHLFTWLASSCESTVYKRCALYNAPAHPSVVSHIVLIITGEMKPQLSCVPCARLSIISHTSEALGTRPRTHLFV